MFSADDEKLGRARLMTLGVPTDHHEQLLGWAAESLEPRSRVATYAVTAGVIAICFLLCWGAWTLITIIPASNAYSAAETTGATLIIVRPGWGMAIAAIPFLLLGSYAVMLAVEFIASHELKRAARAMTIIDKNPSIFRKNAAKTALRNSTTAETFLNAYFNSVMFRTVAPVAVVFLLGLAITALELRSYVVAGPNGIVHARMWPPYSTATYTWDQATSVVVGCNSTDDGDDIIFDVAFPDGQKFGIGQSWVGRKERLPALEEIDVRLPPSIPRKLWDWLGRDAMAVRCLSTWGDTVPDGYKRLELLLRTDP